MTSLSILINLRKEINLAKDTFLASKLSGHQNRFSLICTFLFTHAVNLFSHTGKVMPEFLKKVFIDPESLPDGIYGFIQVLFLGAVYGKILFAASTLIADGSEHLLCVDGFKNIVGSVVLPLLGAIPDGVIILFSGIGPNAQETLSIGVGTLAGSTIMLLTIPWALSIIAGRVDIKPNGEANYKKPKLTEGNNSLWKSGVTVGSEIRTNSFIMCGTALLYVIIQIPAILTSKDPSFLDTEAGMMEEKKFAFIGFILAILSFFGYLIWNVVRGSEIIEDTVSELQIDAIRRRIVSLEGLMRNQLSKSSGESYGSTENGPDPETKRKLHRYLLPFFKKYDWNNNNLLEIDEALALFRDLNTNTTRENIQQFFTKFDDDENNYIDINELVNACYAILTAENVVEHSQSPSRASLFNPTEEEVEEEEEEEEHSVPTQLANLPTEQQQYELKKLALIMISQGLLAVLIFSDPMVDVFSSLGKRLDVANFYVAFFLAPLASNASELIAAVNYGRKKTSRSISISISSLIGAATMNNTFGLGIFMGLIAFQGLKWEYTAEVVGILATEFVIGIIAFRRTQRLLDAFVVLSIFPISLLLIQYLNK